jgi:hypothetical protein
MSEDDKESLPEEERIAEDVGETLDVVEEVEEDGILRSSSAMLLSGKKVTEQSGLTFIPDFA